MKYLKLFLPLFLLFTHISHAQNLKIELEDIYGKNTFAAKGVEGFRFAKDGLHYFEMKQGSLLRKRITDGKTVDTLVKYGALKTTEGTRIAVTGYVMNAAQDMLIFHTARKNRYRYSYSSIPYVYHLHSKQLKKLSAVPVMNVSFSPANNKIAFTRDENIFIYDVATGEEEQITFDKNGNSFINGQSDWVYEETFGVVQGYKWSYDGNKIAYYRFDQSATPTYTFPMYAESKTVQENFSYKYYRPGENMPLISINVYDLEKKTARTISESELNTHIPRVYWAKNSQYLYTFKMSRDQKRLDLLKINIANGNHLTLLKEESNQYVDKSLLDNFYSFNNSSEFIYMSEKEGWRKLYHYHEKTEEEVPLINNSSYDIEDLIGVDEAKKKIYYTAATTPQERHFYVSTITGKAVKQLVKQSGWIDVILSPTKDYFLGTSSDVDGPPEIAIYNIESKKINTLENNQALKEKLDHYSLNKPTFIQIPNRDGIMLNSWMLLPTDFSPTKKYPVLFANYGGPGSQRIINKWGYMNFWYRMLAQKGVIIVGVDNTGTGYRGAEFKKAVHGNLGIKEMDDQIDAAKWLITKHSYMDATRIGYWGWSFGGFMSTMAITYGADVFKTAIAVAPVTNWAYYQAGYAERHMGLLENNGMGYEKSSPIKYIHNLKGNFLLIHGTGDDNVHFRNSAILSQSLIKSDKKFDQYYYPDKDHSMSDNTTRLHLYRLMTAYLLDKL